MSALFILIGVSLFMALGFLAAFIWAVRSDQYDDPESPAMRMLFNATQGMVHDSGEGAKATSNDKAIR